VVAISIVVVLVLIVPSVTSQYCFDDNKDILPVKIKSSNFQWFFLRTL